MKKNILLFDLAGLDFPGGCEKYFANLGMYLSDISSVSSISSPQYRRLMDYVYKIVSGRKLDAIGTTDRETGRIQNREITISSLIWGTTEYQKVKSFLLNQDYIYAKNEFQELALLFYLLGRVEYKKRVIVGVHTPIFLPSKRLTLWKLIHNTQYHSFLYKLFLQSSKQIHVNNKDYKKQVQVVYKIDSEKIIYIPNPVEWKIFLSQGSSRNTFTVIWFGRFTQQKGIDRLEKIIRLLSEDVIFKNIKIIIGGEGEEQYKIERLSQKYKNVTYLGYVQDLTKYYKVADLSFFTAYFDTFAHAVLEPLSFGIPVVSFDIAGPRDMIQPSVNGYLVESEERFVDAVKHFYSIKSRSSPSYMQLKKNIFDDTAKRYDKKMIFFKLSQLFK